jgi:hypothetical protein
MAAESAAVFSAESRLIHAGTDRSPGRERIVLPQDGVEPAADLLADIDQALEVL